MKTKYLGIESIFIQYYDKITVAANIMFGGQHYDQPVYTNIFCDYYHLKWLLNLDESELGKAISAAVVKEFEERNGHNIQIDLPDFLEKGQGEWMFPMSVNIVKDVTNSAPFQCYHFKIASNEI